MTSLVVRNTLILFDLYSGSHRPKTLGYLFRFTLLLHLLRPERVHIHKLLFEIPFGSHDVITFDAFSGSHVLTTF